MVVVLDIEGGFEEGIGSTVLTILASRAGVRIGDESPVVGNVG